MIDLLIGNSFRCEKTVWCNIKYRKAHNVLLMLITYARFFEFTFVLCG